MFKNLFFIVLLTLFCLKTNGQTKTFIKQLDSIQELRQLSKNTGLDIETRILYAKKASELSYKTEVDSVILKSNFLLADCYSDDRRCFRESISLNRKNLILARKLNDSHSKAYINYHLGYAYQHLGISDSTYYYYFKSLKSFRQLKPVKNDYILRQSRIFSNIANLQRKEQDYIGSQVNTIKAINTLLLIPESEDSLDDLSNLYNNLALNLEELKDYENALEYYKKALDISNRLVDSYISELFININIAELYRVIQKYDDAIKILKELLKDKTIEEKDPASYGTILNNMAYNMYLAKDKGYRKIDSLFVKAYNIFSDLDLFYEISASGNDMAEFYYATNKKDKALLYPKRSYEYGKKANCNYEVLRALKILSKLHEGNEGKAYLYEHIKLNDSLIDVERANRNKYARIQFETDQYIKETKRLGSQNILIIAIASISILVLGLLYFIKLQKTKNNELEYITEQELANQEIYKLMLQQRVKQEEARLEERHRMSEDLHDGILPSLFGTRMGMGFLDIKGDESTLKQYKTFIEEIQKIEKDVRDVSHELKSDTIGLKTNFESIIETYIKAQSVAGNFKYKIKNEDEIKFELFNERIRVEIYRIIQEAIQNIVKHAKATVVSVSFILKEDTLQINIIDDGVGFNTEKKNKGIGLKNIASRVLKLEGKLKINSPLDSNKGTEFDIKIPMKNIFKYD